MKKNPITIICFKILPNGKDNCYYVYDDFEYRLFHNEKLDTQFSDFLKYIIIIKSNS